MSDGWSIWDGWIYKKPEWEYHFEFHESTLVRKSGLSKEKLREVIRLFKEYKILDEEGK